MSADPNAVIPPSAGSPSADEKTWGMIAHLAWLAGFVIPFGNVLGPLVVWLVKKETMPFVADQGREALNFQITVLIAALISCVLMFVVIGFFLLLVIGIGSLVLSIIAAMKAQNGEAYRYPVALRLIK